MILGVVFLPLVTLAAPTIDNADDYLKDVAGKTGLDSDLKATGGTVVKTVLALIGTIFFGLTIYAGVRWMTAQGNEEKVTKAKDTLEAALIGIAIVFLAYAITAFVTGSLISGKPGGAPSGGAGDAPPGAMTDAERCSAQAGAWLPLSDTEDACDDSTGYLYSDTVLFTGEEGGTQKVCCEYSDESKAGCTARGGVCANDLFCPAGTNDIGDCPASGDDAHLGDLIDGVDDQCCQAY